MADDPRSLITPHQEAIEKMAQETLELQGILDTEVPNGPLTVQQTYELLEQWQSGLMALQGKMETLSDQVRVRLGKLEDLELDDLLALEEMEG